MKLENQNLIVEFHETFPSIRAWTHRSSGERIAGDAAANPLEINGERIPWGEIELDRTSSEHSIIYRIRYGEIAFTYGFELDASTLHLSISDVEGPLRSIGFGGPLLCVSSSDYRYARITTTEPNENGKKWWREEFGAVAGGSAGERHEDPNLNARADAVDTIVEREVVHGCLYHPDRLCVFAHSNYPLQPERHRQTEAGYEIWLSEYRYRIRSRTMWPLRASVVFIEDINGDGTIDWSDCALWINRTLPDADAIYRTAISYKIFLTHRDEMVVTNYDQMAEIIESIHNIADGLPQLIYMAGWQFQGHDDKYPSMNRINPRPGGKHRLIRMIDNCEERYDALISYHINIDDAYIDSPDWDPAYMTSADWDPTDSGTAFGVVHTLDWEQGHFERRMSELLATVPVKKTIHVDNTRICNTFGREIDGIGELEELFCGLLPISQWLKERGITLTTEGTNGMPIDGTLLFSGWFHYDAGIMGRQILHRKMVGGGAGRHFGEPTARDYALGSNIHVDFGYERREFVVSYREDFRGMIDRIFLGTLLYLYFLELEMTVCRTRSEGEIHIEYGDGTVVDITSAHTMTVTKGDLVIARDNDTRCIPLGDALYIYSTVGDRQTFMLPPEWRGREIEMVMLTRDGPEIHDLALPEHWHYRILEDRIAFHWMPPYVPYRVTLKDRDG